MATPIGQNKDGTYIYAEEQNMSVMPKAPKPAFKPITPESTGIPSVGVPQVPWLSPVLPQSLIDKSQPMPEDKTPEAFKRMITLKFPEWVTNDGRKYADLDPYEITKLIVDKFPDGVTNAGINYKDYLPEPKTRREKFIASGQKIPDRGQVLSNLKRDITAPYRGVYGALEGSSIGLQSVAADWLDLLWFEDTATNLRGQLTEEKKKLWEKTAGDVGLIEGIQTGDPSSVVSALVGGVTSLMLSATPAGAAGMIWGTTGNISLEWEEQGKWKAKDKAFAYGAGVASGLLDKIAAGKVLDGLLAKWVPPDVAKWVVKKTKNFLLSLKPSTFEAGTEILQQRIEDWGRDLMGVEYDRTWKDYAEAGLMGKILGKVGDTDTQTLNDAMGKKWTVKDKLTRTIPEKTVSNYLSLTPTERGNVEKILWGKTAEQYILENNLWGVPKGELTDHFQKQATDSYNGIKEQLAPITERIESTGAKNAISDMLETFDGLSSLEKSVYEKDINYLQKLSEQEDYTLSELHALRQAFDKVNTGMYTAKWAVRSGTRAGAEVEVRNQLSNDIQENALKYGVDVKKINQDLRVALTLKDGLLRSLSQEAKNNLVWLQDIGIMGIFSWGEPLTALSLGIGKKFLEGQMPWAAQKLYNLNKTPYENTAVKRGNTIATGTGSSLFGLPSSMGDSDASGVPQVKPNIIISKNPAEILAFELSNGKIDVKKAIEAMKKLSPEEIASQPELRKLQEIDWIVSYVDNVEAEYWVMPPEEITGLVKQIQDGKYTPEQKKYIMDNTPKEVKSEIQKQNRIRDYGKDFTEKEVVEKKPVDKKKKERQTTSKGKLVFMERYDDMTTNVGWERLYKIAKYFEDNNVEDLTSYGEEPVLSWTKRSQKLKYQRELKEYEEHKKLVQEYAKEVETAAQDMRIDSDELYNDIRDLYNDIDSGKVGTIDDAITKWEADYEVMLEKQRELQSLQEVADTMPEAPTTTETIEEVVSTPEPVKESPKTPQVEGKTGGDYDKMRWGEYNPELKKIRDEAKKYELEYEKLDTQILELQDKWEQVSKELMKKRVDAQKKMRELNWKAETLFEEIKIKNNEDILKKPSLPLSQKSEVKYSEAIENKIPDNILKFKKSDTQTVYHWTRHEFDDFDVSRLYTWEGNTGFWEGIYFADKWGARGYANKLAQEKWEWKVYKAVIPADKYLMDLDKYIDEQPYIQKALGKLPDDVKETILKETNRFKGKWQELEDITEYSANWSSLYKLLEQEYGSAEATEILNRVWIKWNVFNFSDNERYQVIFDNDYMKKI